MTSGDTLMPSPPAQAGLPASPRLVGDLAIWMLISVEMATFSIMFAAFAFLRASAPALFDAGQQTLHTQSGAINTLLLVSGSACVAAAVRAMRLGQLGPVRLWLGGALLCGSGFVALKWHEWLAQWSAGHDFGSDDFYTFYFMLTGFHFLHVLAAMAFLSVMLALHLRHGRSASLHALESAAAFWHMVDLLWIVLFPLVYVLR